PETKDLIVNALAPAVIENIDIDQDAKVANVTVQVSQAPLAIGKGGVNVNLAAELTNLTINIIQISDQTEPAPDASPTEAAAPESTETPKESVAPEA
ncbi:MAG TPA: KH domain-containing protein, partial [Candidatus Woesebacteria bacterium]|nr:KH domain-containing protein [Candidatus Woesebacteria bacterium]